MINPEARLCGLREVAAVQALGEVLELHLGRCRVAVAARLVQPLLRRGRPGRMQPAFTQQVHYHVLRCAECMVVARPCG